MLFFHIFILVFLYFINLYFSCFLPSFNFTYQNNIYKYRDKIYCNIETILNGRNDHLIFKTTLIKIVEFANSVDPDGTAWSGSALFSLLSLNSQ